jgi:hypothetical protein
MERQRRNALVSLLRDLVSQPGEGRGGMQRENIPAQPDFVPFRQQGRRGVMRVRRA